MPDYGYGTPFQGQLTGLPPGYMQAATEPGRNLAAGIGSLGQGIGRMIERYVDHSNQSDFYNQKYADMVKMAGGIITRGNITDPNAPESHLYNSIKGIVGAENPQDLLDKSAKFPTVSLSKKKAIVADLAYTLDKYDKMAEQAPQAALQGMQLKQMQQQMADADEQRRQLGLQTQAMGMALNAPTERQVSQPLNQGVIDYTQQGPPLPKLDVPVTRQAQSSPEQVMAVRNYLQAQSTIPNLQQYASGLDQKIEALKTAATVKIASKPVNAGGTGFTGLPGGGGQRIGGQFANETPGEAAARAVEASRQLPALIAERTNLQKQIDALTKMPAPTGNPTVTETQQVEQQGPTAVQGPAGTLQGPGVPMTQPVTFDDQVKTIQKSLIGLGANAQTLSIVPQILKIAGQEKGLDVQSVLDPNSGATIIRADGKIDILPPPKPIEGKPLTDEQSKAVGFASRMMMHENTLSELDKAGFTGTSMLSNTYSPEWLKGEDRKVYEDAKQNWISAQLRKESGAAISANEYKTAAAEYFPQVGDTEKVLKKKKALRELATRAMVSAIGPNANVYLGQVQGSIQPSGGALPVRQYNRATGKFE